MAAFNGFVVSIYALLNHQHFLFCGKVYQDSVKIYEVNSGYPTSKPKLKFEFFAKASIWLFLGFCVLVYHNNLQTYECRCATKPLLLHIKKQNNRLRTCISLSFIFNKKKMFKIVVHFGDVGIRFVFIFFLSSYFCAKAG